MNKNPLDSSISELPATSPVTIKRFKSLGIDTYFDLLDYYPTRYIDYSVVSPIDKLQEGELVTVKGKITSMKQIYTRRGMTMQKAVLSQGIHSMEITWFNQPYLLTQLRNRYVSLAGTVKLFGKFKTIEVQEYELLNTLEDETIHTGRIVPIYSEKRGMSSKLIRDKIYRVIQFVKKEIVGFPSYLPSSIIASHNLMNLKEAYMSVHFPTSIQNAGAARRTLAFEELFTIQLSAAFTRKKWLEETVSKPLDYSSAIEKKLTNIEKKLPFQLTQAQKKAFAEIITDMQKKKPMNRFLQGDVGSGKTVVAGLAATLTFLNGMSTLVMAPTEILAKQHFHTFNTLFPSMKTILITRSSKPTEKEKKEADVIVGTHALLNDKHRFKKIGFVVVDEQHRFGVAQRALLKSKGMNPHLLTMTATPIPRTVILTLYGELDLSVINEMPKGRLPIKTFVIPKEKRSDGYKWINEMIQKEHIQTFIICPMIEESEEESMQSVKAAKKEYEYLKTTVFPSRNVALLHGKMKSLQKNEVMADFKDKKYDILVATSVVEVGIDVPNATIMIIEGAERFGLAQLHQLRGRVGRGSKQSYCFLFTEKDDPSVLHRLSFFAKNTSGMDIAEYDLKLRGPGELYGMKQHGYTDLKIASLSDLALIAQTKRAVNDFVKTGEKIETYPRLQKNLEKHETRLIAHD